MGADWTKSRWLAFDTETTGVDTTNDRIISAHVALIGGGSIAETWSWLINPGMPIPEAATNVHGITDDQVRENGEASGPAIAEIAAHLTTALAAGIPVVGWNVCFDLTMLDTELRRHGLKSLEQRIGGPVRPVLDGLVLDKACDRYRKGSRKLVDVARLYGVMLTDQDAHGAAADAMAAARTVWKMAQKYPSLTELDIFQLHDYQCEQALEQQASLEAYFRKTKPDAVVERGWPLRVPA